MELPKRFAHSVQSWSRKYSYWLSWWKFSTHMRHSQVVNRFTEIIHDVCCDVEVEPSLHMLEDESFFNTSTRTDDSARHDIKANGFWVSTKVIFEITLTSNPNPPFMLLSVLVGLTFPANKKFAAEEVRAIILLELCLVYIIFFT